MLSLLFLLLLSLKCVTAAYELYLKEVQKLRLIFNNNGYSNWLIDNTLIKFEEQSTAKNSSQKPEKHFFYTLCLPYFENCSR